MSVTLAEGVMKRYPNDIVATCVIPWDTEFKFAEAMFRRQVRFLRQNLTRHLYVFGTAGEGYAVTESQFDTIACVFREETDFADTTAMLGVISVSLPTIIERIARGRKIGFRHFQISLPSWGALNSKEIDSFFRETCGRFSDCKFLHYNLMRTKKLLNGDDYARLAAAHPNLVAVKTGSADRDFLTDMIRKAPELQFCVGELAYGMLRDEFECSLLISLAATNTGMAREFFNARGAPLARLTQEISGTRERFLACLNNGAHMDGAYDKLLYKVHDAEFPLRLLPPYQSADDAIFEKFLQDLPVNWKAAALSTNESDNKTLVRNEHAATHEIVEKNY
jgi:hypothetical protein